MWNSQKASEEHQKLTIENDSGFGSLSAASMRACENAEHELSESFVRNLCIMHASINNLELGRKQIVEEEPELDTSDKIDVLKESYELFYNQDCNGNTQLHLSIVMNHVESSLWLIGLAPHPCLLDIVNDESQSALHLAVMASEPQIVRRLVLAGANRNLRTFAGNSALHLACNHGDVVCAKALTEPFSNLEKNWIASKSLVRNARMPVNANLELRNYTGKTCLHMAAYKGHAEIVSQLLRLGADVDAQEGLGGKTALHLAIENGHRDVVQVLVRECPSCLEAVTYAGDTAYQIALDIDRELAEELLRLGASPIPQRVSDSDSSSEDDLL